MARIASTVAALGVGAHDGELAYIKTASEQIRLRWNEADALWCGDVMQTISFGDLEPMDCNGGAGWKYLSVPHSASARAYSWSPTAIRGADEAYAAGLVLQEKIDSNLRVWDADGDYRLAVVYYNKDDGDTIAPGELPDDTSPGRDVGTELVGTPTVRCMVSTGWVLCPIDTPTEANLAPHFYTRQVAAGGTDGGARVEYAAAYARWIAVP